MALILRHIDVDLFGFTKKYFSLITARIGLRDSGQIILFGILKSSKNYYKIL